MKAAINGVPSLSILDGWWLEGCIESVTGWAIDSAAPVTGDRTPHDASSLYDKLENTVIPLFYKNRNGFIDVMRHRSRSMDPSSAPKECSCGTCSRLTSSHDRRMKCSHRSK